MPICGECGVTLPLARTHCASITPNPCPRSSRRAQAKRFGAVEGIRIGKGQILVADLGEGPRIAAAGIATTAGIATAAAVRQAGQDDLAIGRDRDGDRADVGPQRAGGTDKTAD